MVEFYTYTLPNGIRGIHRQTSSSVAYCGLIVGCGTRDEREGEFGLAHFTEHGLFKGTERRRAYQVNCRLENLGGELNAYTTKEETTIHATTLKGDFRKAVELLSDVTFRSTFPDHEMEREREVVYDEINAYKDSPAEMIYDNFEDMIFGGSEMGHNILGVKRDIRRFSGDKIRQFTKRCYTTDQMVFSSIGGVSIKRAEDIARHYFGEFAATSREFERVKPQEIAPFSIAENRRTHQTHCIIGCRAYSIVEPKRLPLALLINILGGPSANSLLNILVRERHGLTYNIEASYTPYSDTGLVTIYFSSESANADRVVEMIHSEMERLRTTLLTPRQLSMAKRQFVAQLAISMESNEGYMLGAGKSYLLHGVVDTVEESYRRVAAITAEEVRDVANEVLQNMSMLTYK
ncbi:MAG: pitrilysin family protein [Rikenellaceae bacterium]